MNVGIIGSGGREHAICFMLSKSKKVSKIFCFPGNAGTNLIAENVNLNSDNFSELEEYCIEKEIKLIVVGPEKPLVNGIVDHFKGKSIKIFGPDKISSKLEGSKIFTKKICQKFNIPTAKFGIFKSLKSAKKYFDNCNFPIVIKADGLASGKGVYICENKDQAITGSKEIFNGKFGKAKSILIEEFLKGEEMSFFILSDGKNYKFFGTAQDHKRVLEGDKGKNTGGMGAYSPSRLENKTLNKKIIDRIVEPTLIGLKKMGTQYKGFLYVGLMIVKNEPYLIEYNVRMGDPECQTILPKLKTDFVKVINAVVNKKLDQISIEWHNLRSLCVVLCSKGYPDNYQNNLNIPNLNKQKLNNNEYIFHAGTKIYNNKIFSNGGRVLNFVVCSNNFKKNRNRAIRLIDKINWKNGFFRKDIGFKVIKT